MYGTQSLKQLPSGSLWETFPSPDLEGARQKGEFSYSFVAHVKTQLPNSKNKTPSDLGRWNSHSVPHKDATSLWGNSYPRNVSTPCIGGSLSVEVANISHACLPTSPVRRWGKLGLCFTPTSISEELKNSPSMLLLNHAATEGPFVSYALTKWCISVP